MKLIKSFSWCWLALTIVGNTVNGQPDPANINPALTYYRAFELAPDFFAEDRDYLFTNEWRGQKLPDRFGELVTRFDTEFRLVRQAAHAKAPCDWGIDLSAGPDAMLPHLPFIKKVVNAARLRTLWDLQQDRQGDARDDLLAALALGRNGAHNSCLIGVLVQFAVERLVCATIAENFNRFSPDVLQQLAAGLDQPPSRGMVADCMGVEKSAFEDWFVNQIAELRQANPDSDAKVMDGLHRIVDRVTALNEEPKRAQRWQEMVVASGGSSDGILHLVGEMDPLYARLANIVTLPRPQYEEQMKQFSADIHSSTNPFVQEFFPPLEKCRTREFCALAELAIVKAAVQYKLHGTAGLQSVNNPVGEGPFGFKRVLFDGVDRGFELDASYAGLGYPEVIDFVETDGPPFEVFGKKAGKAPTP
ncbi:MAG: hypothetical protein ACLQVY_20240 [Limisphaerales bacterium]